MPRRLDGPTAVAGKRSDRPDTVITAEYAFKRFRSKEGQALLIGAHCTMDGVHFAVGGEGKVAIGDYCYFTNAVLLCELELRFGNLRRHWLERNDCRYRFHPLAAR